MTKIHVARVEQFGSHCRLLSCAGGLSPCNKVRNHFRSIRYSNCQVKDPLTNCSDGSASPCTAFRCTETRKFCYPFVQLPLPDAITDAQLAHVTPQALSRPDRPCGQLPDPVRQQAADRPCKPCLSSCKHPRPFCASVHPSRAFYLWGPVGRGKTLLMDLFARSLPDTLVRRQHFHHFMADVHAQLRTLAGRPDPLAVIADTLAKRIRLCVLMNFCFGYRRRHAAGTPATTPV